MDFSLTDQQLAMKKQFECFFKEEMKAAPPCYKGTRLEAIYASDEGWEFHKKMQRKMGAKGWLSMAWPNIYGGEEVSLIEQLIFSEVHAYYHAPGIDIFGLRMFAPTLMLYASEEQKSRLLPPIARGEVNYCQGWSEPDAGSDLASLRTTATRVGDHYVVNGQKVWTTGGQRADHMFLLARTDPMSKRSRGLSVFNVRMDTPGIEVKPIHYMNRKHVYNEVFFTDVAISEKDRIGPENEGWKSTRETMNFERSGAATFSELKHIFEDLLVYVRTTKQGKKYLYEKQNVRASLAKIYADLERGRALAYRIAWIQQMGKRKNIASLASESKVFGTELRQKLASVGTEIMGLYGQVLDSKWAPLSGIMPDSYQFCLGYNISAGSSEIQRNIIAWTGLGLPRVK